MYGNGVGNILTILFGKIMRQLDRITFWIDDCLYQVQRTDEGYNIFIYDTLRRIYKEHIQVTLNI